VDSVLSNDLRVGGEIAKDLEQWGVPIPIVRRERKGVRRG